MTIYPSESNSNTSLLTYHFHDVDQATEILSQYREIQVTQLSLTPFQSQFYQVDFGDLLIRFAEINSPIHLVGVRRTNFIQFFLLLQLGEQNPLVHKQSIDSYTLSGFNPHRSTDSIFFSKTIISEIQVKQSLFESMCQTLKREDLDHQFLQKDLIQLPDSLSPYRRYLHDLFYLIKTQSPLLLTPSYYQIILGDLLPLLIDAIPQKETIVKTFSPSNQRGKVAEKGREFILTHLHQPLTLKDIYQALGVSRRTLFYSFESIFGMTPMAYVKAMRLQGIRRELKLADPKHTMIMNITHKWGFWSSGHFARDYKQMFGELPSETLKSFS